MPVAGQGTALVEGTFAQRITFVGTAVIAGKNALGCIEKNDLLAFAAHNSFALQF